MRNLFFVSLLSISCTLSAGHGDDDCYSSDRILLSAKIYNRSKVIQDLELRCKELIILELQTSDTKLQKLYQEKQNILAAQSAILEHHQGELTLKADDDKRFEMLTIQLLLNQRTIDMTIDFPTSEMNGANGRDSTHARLTLLDNFTSNEHYLPLSLYEYGRPSKTQTVQTVNNPPRPASPLALLDGTPTLPSYLITPSPSESTQLFSRNKRKRKVELPQGGKEQYVESSALPLTSYCVFLYFKRLGASENEMRAAMGVKKSTFKQIRSASLRETQTIPLKQLKEETDRYIQRKTTDQVAMLRALEKKCIETRETDTQNCLHMQKKQRVGMGSSSTPSSM